MINRMLRFNRAHFHAVLPHVHRLFGCVVCGTESSDELPTPSGRSGAPVSKSGPVSKNQFIHSSSTGVVPSGSGDPKTHPVKPCGVPSFTVEEMRRDALRSWMQMPFEGEQVEECEVLLRQGGPWSEVVARRLTDYLDTRCQRCNGGTAPIPVAERSAEENKFPNYLVIPQTESFVDGGAIRNVFMERVRQKLPNRTQWEKQEKFQAALLAVQRALESCGISFFLCCGTALGAHREGYFIPHDEDIDIGIFYSELATLGKQHGRDVTRSSAILEKHCGVGAVEKPAEEHATNGFIELCSTLTHVGGGIIFDVCGTVAKGLEIRLLHAETGVRVDVNVYYPPISLEDDELVQRYGPFVWASSFYEQAAERRHNMYRYRHKPFQHQLVRVPFCALSSFGGTKSGDKGFLVPPVSYLEEYFGAEWRRPKPFTYVEGLRNEFRNIIEE